MSVLTVTKDVKTVDEAEVDAEIKRMQERNGRLLTRDGEAQNGDTATIDFEGLWMARLLRAARPSITPWCWAAAPSSPASRSRLWATRLATSST